MATDGTTPAGGNAAKQPRLTEPEARAAFLALGVARSLHKLHSWLQENCKDKKVPSFRTIAQWSSDNDWQKLAGEHDAKASETAGAILAKAQGKALADIGVSGDQVLVELARLGFANMTDFLRVTPEGDAWIDLSVLEQRPELGALLQEVTVEDFVDGRGENARDVRRVKIKLHSKLDALGKLAQYFGLLKGHPDQPVTPANTTVNLTQVNNNTTIRVTPEQVKAELADIFKELAGEPVVIEHDDASAASQEPPKRH